MTSKLLSLGGKVGYQEVREYLKSRGWREVPSKRSYAAIYRHDEHDDAEVLVPLERSLSDYDLAMARAAQEVATVEDRPAEAVLRDLLHPRKDVLRFALEGEGIGPGAVGLNEGWMLLGGARKALLASACSVKNPKRYHPRMSLGDAEVFVRHCQLGQTEAGSFVLVIESPFDIDAQRAITSEPFGRRAIEYLFRSVATLADCIRRDRVERLMEADPDPSMPVVSANLCDALTEMLPPGGTADLRLHGSWSPLLPSPSNVPSTVTIDRTMHAVIDELRQHLRPSSGPRRAQFVGRVVELAGSPSLEGAMEGEVTLAVNGPDDDEPLRVRASLSPADYEKAARAHLQQRFITVVGILHRGQRAHALREPSDFTMIGEAAPNAGQPVELLTSSDSGLAVLRGYQAPENRGFVGLAAAALAACTEQRRPDPPPPAPPSAASTKPPGTTLTSRPPAPTSPRPRRHGLRHRRRRRAAVGHPSRESRGAGDDRAGAFHRRRLGARAA